ncbi:MAG: urease accessory protein UreF [Cyanobacteria bacterium J06648_16]
MPTECDSSIQGGTAYNRIPAVDLSATGLLRLMQLASPTLPVGGYSYSEGLETLVAQGLVTDAQTFDQWLVQTLRYGSLRIEGAMVVRSHRALAESNHSQLNGWNHWLSAARETAELRRQSWQMGRSLTRLLTQMDPTMRHWIDACEPPHNWAILLGAAAAHWQISADATLLAFYQSWASNLIGGGIKLIPLGQTTGQQLLFNLTPRLAATVAAVTKLKDEDLSSGSWGLALASSQHETQRVRLFQS